MICNNIGINEKGHITFAGQDVCDLAQKYGTPLYLMDEDKIRENCRTYKAAMDTCFASALPVYASKAACFKRMYEIIAEEGFGIDVVSVGEIYTAMKAGMSLENAYFHSNNKTDFDIEFAIENGVGYFVVDNEEELYAIERINDGNAQKQKVLLRLTPGIDTHTYEAVNTGKVDSKFGSAIETGQAEEITRLALGMQNIALAGFHCHIGSQIFALHSFTEAVQVMAKFVARTRDEYGLYVEDLDLGGGLGVAYLADDNPSSIEEFAEVTASAVMESSLEYGLPMPRLLVEPGRSLVANAGVTLYTVGVMKTLPNIRKYVAIDGGMSDNIRTALYHADYEATIANKADQPRTEVVTLCGKHCESGDAVVLDGSLQHADLGDIVCVFTTGAYCYTMSSTYNGQPRPAIVFVRDGQARVVTRRETYDDLMARDI